MFKSIKSLHLDIAEVGGRETRTSGSRTAQITGVLPTYLCQTEADKGIIEGGDDKSEDKPRRTTISW